MRVLSVSLLRVVTLSVIGWNGMLVAISSQEILSFAGERGYIALKTGNSQLSEELGRRSGFSLALPVSGHPSLSRNKLNCVYERL